MVQVSVSTRYAMSISLAGALIYGVIGAVTLGWQWGVLIALWALVLGATFSVVKAFSAEEAPLVGDVARHHESDPPGHNRSCGLVQDHATSCSSFKALPAG